MYKNVCVQRGDFLLFPIKTRTTKATTSRTETPKATAKTKKHPHA